MAGSSGIAAFSLHRLGAQRLLLDSRRQRVYALNEAAALIWSELEIGRSPAQIARVMGERLGMPFEEAMACVTDLIQGYESLPVDERASQHPPAGGHVPLPVGAADYVATYQMLRCTFRMHYMERRLFDAVHPLLDCLKTSISAPTELVNMYALSRAGGVAFVSGGRLIASADAIDAAAVAARAAFVQLAVDRLGGLCALHSGALCRDGTALLLPGDAGSGKSTLAAGLAAQGFTLLCDDTTVLSGDGLVHSLPAGLCLKRGAVAALQTRYPGLACLPEWRRPDGQMARYLAPGDDLQWARPDARAAVRWIVFPHYHPDHVTALRAIDRHEALARLLRGLCVLSGRLDRAAFSRLLAWIESVDCFALPLSSLDEGTEAIAGLCR